MATFMSFLSDPIVCSVLVFLVGVTILIICKMFRAKKQFSSACLVLEKNFEKFLQPNVLPPNYPPDETLRSMVTHLRSCFVSIRQSTQGHKIVLTKHLEEILEESVTRHCSKVVSFHAASWITGIALFFTFLLIALVLHSDIGPAIKASSTVVNGETAAQTGSAVQNLASGVEKIGGKFIISCFGILLSIIATWVGTGQKKSMVAHAISLGQKLHDQIDTVTEVSYFQRQEELNQGQAMIEHLQQLRKETSALSSIQVSVQDLGTEVQHHLSQVIKTSVGEEITTGLAEIRGFIQDSVETLQKGMQSLIDASLHELSQQLVASLQKIEAAVQGSAKTEITGLLESLKDTIGGAYRGEQEGMALTLRNFSQALPKFTDMFGKMEMTLQGFLKDLGHQQGKSVQEAIEATSVMREIMARQQNQLEGTVTLIGNQFQALQATLLDSFQSASTHLVNHVGGEAQQQVTQIYQQLSKLETFVEESQGRFSDRTSVFLKTMETSTAQILEGFKQTTNVTSQFATLMKDLDAAAAQFQFASRAAADSGSSLKNQLESYLKLVSQMDAISVSLSETSRLQKETTSIEVQTLEQIREHWPKLYEVFLDKFQLMSQHIHQNWEALARDASQMFQGTSTHNNNLEELKESVEELTQAIRNEQTAKRTLRQGA